jgi:thiamine-phosphate pyrophosphorylase
MNYRTGFDLSVYFVLDPALCKGRSAADVAEAALAGGVSFMQLRDKSEDSEAQLYMAEKILKLARAAKVPLLINDHVDIALKSSADGVHLGQGDMPPDTARKLLGAERIVGWTAFEENHFKKIDSKIVDYCGTGPFYPTKTDKGKPVMGPEKFAAMIKNSPVPVVGIGGITAENAGAVIRAGASGVAMMRSISEAPDPEFAARMIKAAVETARLEAA